MRNHMKMLIVGLFLTLAPGLFAETPIRTSSNKDSEPAVAYNSTADEYLVVWSEWGPLGGGNYILGPVWGQRVKADGTLVGTAFTIFSAFAADASVAYNTTANEYLVVASSAGIQGQRVSATGTLIGSPTLLMANAAAPTVVYNSLDNSFLLIAVDLYDSGFPDLCNMKVYSRRITAGGQPGGNTNLLRDQGHGLCADGPRYAVDYAPIMATETPKGRFLLAIDTPADLTMLDHNGVIVSKVINSQSGVTVDDHVPFQQSKIGIAHNVDVAYGTWEGESAFMVVWGDRDQEINNQEWTGIWAGIVSATEIEFDAQAGVSNTVFPVSRIAYHWATPDFAKSWAPVVAYNTIAEKFMIAWRETPTTDPLNSTKVNHIRANAVNSSVTPPPNNVVLSAIAGNEDPKAPAIAPSTKSANALVVWEDARNFATTDTDLYGNLFSTTPAKTLSLTAPNGGEKWQTGTPQQVKWQSQGIGSFDVTIEYSNDNGATYNFVAFQTNTDGSNTYNWTVPNTLSSLCLVRISVSGLTDISDATFAITAQSNTPSGKNVNVSLGNGIDAKFDDVTGTGNTTLNVTQTGSPPPNGFLIFPSGTPKYYNIETTATFTGNIEICIKYDDSSLTPIEESKLRLYVFETPPGKWKDITTSLDVTANVICGKVNHLSEFAMMLGPSHFKFAFNTGDSYSIILDAVTFDGNPLSSGDEIGVFTPAGLCVGAAVWDGTTPLALTAWIDDSQTPNLVDGYVPGEQMSFRVWLASSQFTGEAEATATYAQGDGTFGNGPFARISSLAATSTVQRMLSLSQGWNWISLNVAPSAPSMESVMAGITNLVIVVNNAGQFYIPQTINSIGDFDVREGYKVFLSAADQLSVTGLQMEASAPILLTAGWNFVSYLPNSSTPAETALNSIVNELEIAKNDAGQFYVPNLINSLGNMTPGKGYKLYLKANATLVYPQGSSFAKVSANHMGSARLNAGHFNFTSRTGESFSIVVKTKDPLFMAGDEIGVFTPAGLCVGAGVWDGSGILGISAWADDDRTETVDGFRAGEAMQFRLWKADKNHEVNLKAIFKAGSDRFGESPFALVAVQSSTIPTTYLLEQNYPNPFNAGTVISYNLPESGKVTLTIYNLLGEHVLTLVDEEQKAGSYRLRWEGRDSFGRSVPSGVYLYRLKSSAFTAVKKAAFVK